MDRPAAIDDDLDRLRAVAERMDDMFTIGLPDARGWTFVGGRFSIDIAGSTHTFSAGAADRDPDRAFRRCVAEAAETMAQRLEGRSGGVACLDEPTGLRGDEIDVLSGMAGEGVKGGWVHALRMSDRSAASVPAALCFRDAGAVGVAISHGCACGASIDHATRSAVLELAERDAVALWWHGGSQAARLPDLDMAMQKERGDAPARRTWFLDVTSDLEIPVVAAISCDDDGRDIAAGFAARADVLSAADAAFDELVQMELGNRLVRLKLERGGDAALGDVERRQWRRMTQLSADHPALGGSVGSKTAPLTVEPHLRLAAAGFDAYLLDMTVPQIGIPTVKVIAPALQGDPGRWVTQRLLDARKNNGHHASEVSTPGILW